ncbi:toxin-antitoxin system YwqK family antitoxin [Aggregatibacter kilianii]|uniref:toxin-antitoxin system YwqK family antitoxin n=1 Tax=Aggregatibacter kilianii TaxID=2025884 RepID=UPI001955090C|nr:hypothetical protein [Aggregatibacter kilianii]
MMKKWWLISLTMLAESGYAADPTYDVTKGALQNDPALCGYGYNPNCSSGSYSGGSSSQYTPPPPLTRCEVLKNGNERCYRYYDAAHTILESVITQTPKGATVGEYVRYSPSGKPLAIMQYNNEGQKHGKMVFYREDGTLKGDIQYQNDLEHGLDRVYDENGKLFKVWEHKHGHIIHMQEMDGNVKHGKEEFYRTNNKGEDEVYRTQEWENGKLVK